LEHFAEIYAGLGWRRIVVSAFTCYFDASGTQHDQLALAVAGFLSTADCWLEFEREWKKRLQKSGLKYFHRKEIGNKHPGLVADLASIIRDHAQRKFGMVVRVKAMHDLVSEIDIANWSLDAYSYAGRACAAYVRMWADKHHLRNLPEMVFASGDKGRDQLEHRLKKDGFEAVFRAAIEQVDRKTGRVLSAAAPLQAADLFAYELFAPTRKKERLSTGIRKT
jgi:hypothetical protein